VTQEVVDGVRWIPGRDRFIPDSHMYVIGKADAGDFSLIDCGLMQMGGYKLEEIEGCGISLKQVKRIIMTHTHLDHIGCLPELLEAIPHAELWVHANEASYLERGDARIIWGNRMFESMIRSQFTVPEGLFRLKVHKKLEDGEELSLGGLSFRVIHLPGHSSGSIGLFNEEHRLFMSGDTIYADGAIGRFDLFSADPSQLRQSLNKIATLGVDILLPCHNRIVKGRAEQMIKNTVIQWAPMLGD
jgi:hydroxyacylglutathione hydrolase